MRLIIPLWKNTTWMSLQVCKLMQPGEDQLEYFMVSPHGLLCGQFVVTAWTNGQSKDKLKLVMPKCY